MIYKFTLIGLGGFIGAICRYLISGIIPIKSNLPMGTFLVNLIGSFILGFLMYSSIFLPISQKSKLFIGTGFCGALTTFSTFSYETFVLLEERLFIKAFLNIFINVFICLLFVFVGRSIAFILFRK